MRGKVEQLTKSRTGKSWRVLISGTWYGANFDSKIDSQLGKIVDFEFDDGKYGPWLETWGPDLTPSAPIPQAPTAPPSQSSGGDRFYMPFVSNVVAHGIAAGVIKTPADINQWAKAAHDVAVALDAL